MQEFQVIDFYFIFYMSNNYIEINVFKDFKLLIIEMSTYATFKMRKYIQCTKISKNVHGNEHIHKTSIWQQELDFKTKTLIY